MTNTTTSGRWKAGIQFFVLYLFSIGLIFVVAVGFMRNRGVVETQIAAASTTVPPVQQPVSSTANSQELEQYKAALTANNRIIDSLGQRIQQLESAKTVTVPVPQPTSSNDGEWKQKYASLKANYDQVAEREAEFKAAYKTVTEDNKRLLGQLQSLKGQKN